MALWSGRFEKDMDQIVKQYNAPIDLDQRLYNYDINGSIAHVTMLAAWLGGIIIFFSELGTPMIVGPIFNPSFRKMRISKENMAWILDTTSSPVCVLLPFFGWGATVMGILAVEFEALGITHLTDWSAFCQAIPYQIYPILCLIMVSLVAFTGKEFSAMAKAEKMHAKAYTPRLLAVKQ